MLKSCYTFISVKLFCCNQRILRTRCTFISVRTIHLQVQFAYMEEFL